MVEKIKKWYTQGLWTGMMVENAVKKGLLTRFDAEVILTGAYV